MIEVSDASVVAAFIGVSQMKVFEIVTPFTQTEYVMWQGDLCRVLEVLGRDADYLYRLLVTPSSPQQKDEHKKWLERCRVAAHVPTDIF
jgi:hypothetical protein